MRSLGKKNYRLAGRNLYLNTDTKTLTAYLKQQGWLEPGDSVYLVEKPGEGNMNFVLRVTPDKAGSFVIKQARPWVEKYPNLKAPVERIHVEYKYYQYINQYLQLFKYSPTIVDFDPTHNVLAMEDLGQTVDFSFVYQQGKCFSRPDLEAAIDYLNSLKQLPAPKNYPSNLALRKLNHQHIFGLPLEDNPFDLDQIQPGLQQLARECQRDRQLVDLVRKLGDHYLSTGNYLLHGDFYPGSLLKTTTGLKVIDPEFSFLGPEEWDIAVFTAHLFLAQTSPERIENVLKLYQPSADFDNYKFAAFAGIEILRRLIGLAQVPVELTLDEKSSLIQDAISWIKTGKIPTLSGYEKDYLIN